MSICHLGKYYPPASGGMETHVQALARGQAELGARVRVICVNHQDRRGRDATWKSLAFTPTLEDRDGAVRITRVGRWASLARFDCCLGLPRLLRLLQGDAPDVLHLHVPNPTMLLALAWACPQRPLFVSYHSDVIRQKTLGRFLRPLEHLVFRRASRILTTSKAYAEGSEVLHHYRNRLDSLPLGIDLEPFLTPSRAAVEHTWLLKEKHGEILWLMVGRLVYYKGIDTAIQALAQVPGKLLIIGDGPLKKRLQRLADRLGVAERIIWLGQVSKEDLVGSYHAATALWFPSNARSEGFGLVQVEAMASRCPVINTAIPASGVPWVSLHEETGLTVAMNDASGLARAAQRLLAEAGLRERLADAGRERAQQEFDYRLMARRSLEIYRHALARGISSTRPFLNAVHADALVTDL